MQLDSDTREKIQGLVKQSRVVLFMKGSKSFPQCGFSQAVVGILKEIGVEFATVNVLSDATVRDGIKVFSDWPTIPQLYIDGQFIGGCDIVREMHATGELQKALGVEVKPVKVPKITVSSAAVAAFKEADDQGADRLRIEIDPAFSVDLFFGPPQAGDLEVTANGLVFLVDPASAKRADGISIDYVDGPDGAGFKIENPNAPVSVKPLSAKDLAAMLKAGAVHLFDVRTEREIQTAKIPGAVPLEGEGQKILESLDKNTPIVFHCHHGVRSLAAAEHYLGRGFKRVHNLSGGIDAWSRDVDATVPKY